MSRSKKPYRIVKHRRKDKSTHEIIFSRNWNIHFKDHLHIERKITGTPDKEISRHLARNIVAIVNNRISNQPLTPEQRKFIESQSPKLRGKLLAWHILDANTNAGFEPLMVFEKIKANNSKLLKHDVSGGHVFHWQKSMQANERSKKHIKESISKVANIIDNCDFSVPSDIDGEKFKNWLSDLRNQGKTICNANGYLTSFKAFTLWLLKTGRISENPIRNITPLKKLNKERPRRPLTQDQINVLMTATVEADKHHGLTGYERSLVYRIALGTGLRYNEIYTLKRKDIVTKELKINIQASNSKNSKRDTLPLTEELAKELTEYFANNLGMPHTKAFSAMWKDSGAAMLRPDLELAGIEYKNDDGVADFHGLRHTFGTLLAQSGVLPQEAQKLMRHSDINLTMGVYTHLKLSDKAAAIKKLPPIKIIKKKQAKTGTADTPENLTANLTKNPIKIHQDTAKSNKVEVCKAKDVKTITPCKPSSLQKVTAIRPTGLEPVTYGLEIRCSIQLSYGRKDLKQNRWVFYR